jgi:sodium transport system permease protein
MSGLVTVFKKEMKDSLRDRRALLTAMLPAIFGPLMIMTLLSSAAETLKEADDLTLQVIGRENAPDLIAYILENDILIEDFEGDPKTEIQAKNVDVILEIPEDYREKFSTFQTASIFLFADESLEKSERASDRIASLLRRYNREIGTLRLMVRGINPAVASPLFYEKRDFSTRTSRASKILASLQMFLLMAAFFGGAGVAIDTTAGERERNSLEPLLVHPLSSQEIMGGKWITVSLYGVLATLLVVLSTAIGLEFISLEALGVDPKLTRYMQLRIFALLLPMAFLASAAQMLASLFAKTFKEAQTYLGLLTLLPILPVMLTMFKDVKTADWMYLVPIMGQQQLITSIMRGEGMDFLGFLTTVAVTTAGALLLFAILTKLLRSERVVYGG